MGKASRNKGPKRAIPSGTIGFAAQTTGRFTAFSMSVAQTERPPHTAQVWAIGVDVVDNMNRMVREMEGDWLWIMGDDHRWAPNLLMRLLTRMYDEDMDVLVPTCLMRGAPWNPVIYIKTDDKGGFYPIDLQRSYDYKDRECVEIAAAGSAGMLIRRRVFDAVGKPWFEAGTIHKTGLNEDLAFCLKVREHGFRIHADLTAGLGHMNVFTVWPALRDGKWGIVIEFTEGTEIYLSQEQIDASHASTFEYLKKHNPTELRRRFPESEGMLDK